MVEYERGKFPFKTLTHRDVLLTDGFEIGDMYRHCRGQGAKYKERSKGEEFLVDFVEGHHYNFNGVFTKYCCFCALHAGFEKRSFMDMACYLCRDKDILLEIFSKLYILPSKVISWQTHRWAALPSAILDKILRHVIGEALQVVDGQILTREPERKSE